MDIKIICCNCGKEFFFTSREQEFYLNKGFSFPKRCKKCRENNFSKLGLKQTSYYDNAKTFGPMTNVKGGLYVEYVYYIKSLTKGFLTEGEGGKYFFDENISDKSVSSIDKAKIENLCKNINQRYNLDCEIYGDSKYVHRSCDI